MIGNGPLAMLESCTSETAHHDDPLKLNDKACGSKSRINPAEDEFVLLAGPPGCGKTSLLFQYAANICKLGLHALFICFESRMKERCPLAQAKLSESRKIEVHRRNSHPSLERLHMKYITENSMDQPNKSINMLADYLSQLHRLPNQPHLIILDDISLLNCNAKTMTHILSLLQNMRSYASQVHKLNSRRSNASHMQSLMPLSQNCRVILSDSLSKKEGKACIGLERTILRFVKSTWFVKPIDKSNSIHRESGDNVDSSESIGAADFASYLDFEVSCHVRIPNARTVPTFQMGVYESNGNAILATHVLNEQCQEN